MTIFPRVKCATCLRTSIELWLRFIAYTARSWWQHRSPLSIAASENLARELFSNYVKENGRLRAGAFQASESNRFGISLSRWDKAPRHLFIALGMAKKRGRFSFVGFAVFRSSDLAKVTAANPPLSAIGSLALGNPFHAEIKVRAGLEKSRYMDIDREMRQLVNPSIFDKTAKPV